MCWSTEGENPLRKNLSLLAIFLASIVGGQTPPKLTLADAEALAIKNHPQILAAQHEVSFANQQITAVRSAYYPTLSADVTGSQANHDARLGAGYLNDSTLFNRFGQGVSMSQLITDLGRTKNLVASSRLQAQATDQNLVATKYDVLIAVNRAYFDVLHAQALVKVAEQTVAARQLLDDRVTELSKNQLKSQLDVSLADVTVSEAKLLLINAQAAVEQAFAELARAVGTDQQINYQLVDEAMPPTPPAKPDGLIAQALSSRPELASLRFSRDSAYRFADAEKDLNRPTVSLVGVAGFLPYINQVGSTPIASEYEAAAVNVAIPLFNGHLFSARREAARYRAMESDQRLRDQQERVVRDVRVAWSSTMTAFQRLDVTAQFMRQAALALNLADGRYKLGLSSIIELTQSQLNLTQAEIENLSAKYDYQSQFAALQYAIGALR
jgi:outer membrane protein